MNPWEIHPAIVHFPIALLISAVTLDLYAWSRSKASLKPVVLGLMTAGVVTGIIAAIFGVLAYRTVPAHTEATHHLMQRHMLIQVAAIGSFLILTVALWRDRPPITWSSFRVFGIVAVAMLVYGSFLGGKMVFRGGAGVDPSILAPEVRNGHRHGDESSPQPKNEDQSGEHEDHDHGAH